MDGIKGRLQTAYNSGISTIKQKFDGLMAPSATSNNSKKNTNTISQNNANTIINQSVIGNKSNFGLVVACLITFVLLFVLYFLSKSFRVNKTLETHDIYQQYTTIQSIPFEKSIVKKLRLSDCHVATSYNTALVGYQMFDYVSEDVLKATLRSGARAVEFNIFNSKYGDDAIPVVSNGYKEGEWRMTVDVPSFEDMAKIIDTNAFRIGDGENGVPNPDDPLFILLNLNTNHNLYCLDALSDIIVDYFRDRLLDNKYSYQQTELSNITMEELKGKVVILCSPGFEGSKLDEVVNYSWGMSGMRRLHYSEIENADSREMQSYNKQGITIISPHKEGDFWTENYDPQRAIDLGCQFVMMNWQVVDENMDKYITKFRNNSIVAKPKNLRKNKK